MKPTRIEFIPDLRWRGVWLLAAFACACIGGAAGSIVWKASKASRAARAELAAVNLQIDQLRVQRQEAVDPRRDASLQAAKLLQNDLNKVFSTVENLAEPGTRLAGLSIDAAASLVRLEYQLDSMSRAASVTFALNAGNERSLWNLESVTATAGQQGPVNGAAAPLPVRATWSGTLDRL